MDRRQLPQIDHRKVTKVLLVINIAITLIYFSWWFTPSNIGNPVLYGLLFLGEIYHVLMTLFLWHTLWPPQKIDGAETKQDKQFIPSVDIFIPVVNEPLEVIEKTAKAAKDIIYSNHRVYILNDGLAAKQKNWHEVELLAKKIGVNCITRRHAKGAKAGNINHALRKTHGELIVIFDADMIARPNFLSATVPYFKDQKIGFVQSPQYYKNYKKNSIATGAWEQQEFFFGPVLQGKSRTNSVFLCGTNLVIRRRALQEVGGMGEDNIAEDFITSLLIHKNGWHSKYIREVVAEGLAPEDLLSYVKQQRRWARGSLDVLISFNPLWQSGLSWEQKIQYLSSAFFYLNGLIVFIDMLIPLIFLFWGIRPVNSATSSFALFFVPYMFMILWTLSLASEGRLTFRAISFTMASWPLQLSALKSTLLRQPARFEVTAKKQRQGNFIWLTFPHLVYVALALYGITIAFPREGLDSALITNLAWIAVNVTMFTPFIHAGFTVTNSSDSS